MRILWLINFEIPLLGNDAMVNEGWISGMYSAMKEYYPKTEIVLLYPQNKSLDLCVRHENEVSSIGYHRKENAGEYDPKLKNIFIKVINEAEPDVIHIMGTEYPHTLSMCEACRDLNILDRMVISIQGMVGPYSKAYCIGLPNKVIYGYRLKDLIYGNTFKEMSGFKKRGKYEEKALSIARNIIGRTEWDRMCVRAINANTKYHHNNEVLRETFYGNTWKYEECKPNTVFVSQSHYPIKGLHILLEGAHILKNEGYDLQFRVAGENIFAKPKWKWGRYTKYLADLLIKYDLIGSFEFLGRLNEKEMLMEYLNANIYILPSLIENSPNSLGEAMILGMPVIATDVGGIKDFIKHGDNGYVFPVTEPYMMAFYVADYLNDIEKAGNIGKHARITAEKLFNREHNSADLITIYKSLL